MSTKNLMFLFSVVLMLLIIGACASVVIAQVNSKTVAANTYKGAINRTINVDMVVLSQTIMNNRLGAAIPNGQIYALKHDVTSADTKLDRNGQDSVSTSNQKTTLKPGKVRLKTYKRPRPITLRANVGDTLVIRLTNLLEENSNKFLETAGLQIMGLDWGEDVDNAKRIKPGQTHVYIYEANAEGVFMMYSPNGQSIPSSQLDYGLFGAVNVQPEEAEWYRSQVTANDLELATYKVSAQFMKNYWSSNNPDLCQKRLGYKKTGLPKGIILQRKSVYQQSILVCAKSGENTIWEMRREKKNFDRTEKVSEVVIAKNAKLMSKARQPIINYAALYPDEHPRSGLPILNMLSYNIQSKNYRLVHSDLTAIITGPSAGRFPYYLNSPSFRENPATPDRRQPYREFTINYHISPNTRQAFDAFREGPLVYTLSAGVDKFSVNYGIAGIGPEIYANRINVGPMGINSDGVDLLFEEFFLSAWAVGDPAILVDNPANISARATKALYPDDPSNVYHSYMRDHVKFRVINAGSVAPHVHHQHAHQWLHTPNSDNGHYLDSQMIHPGSTYSLEMTYNGSGNRNQTVGDSIFHCHIYPHFAQGMWGLWRVHDVFEAGTGLNEAGIPNPGARALPDGEITMGTPIPALVPLPTIAMAPIPAEVKLVDNGRRVEVKPSVKNAAGKPIYDNPGFPFFIPGKAGHRAPHPPLDFAWKEDVNKQPKLLSAPEAAAKPFRQQGDKDYLDGGLPRHLVLGGEILSEFHSRWDFSKKLSSMMAMELPEEGTAVEKAAMQAHATRTHASYLPDGLPGNFILNGLPPAPGAPYAAPEVDNQGNSTFNERRYKAAVIQTDVVFNKQGWHYPQQRFITLLDDVSDTVQGKRAPEPFFFRANTDETIEFWHTNLVPNYYQLDDFQVRTPTDILGQHIHLVKFDVTASDGAGNGFNYEDGTFSPDEVRERIAHINSSGGLYHYEPQTGFKMDKQSKLKISSYKEDYGNSLGKPPAGQDWNGAQTTIQRFDTDPLLNNQGEDRTLRTVFTHDHYGPSTHQQAGLYGALLVEPAGSRWFDAISGEPMPNKKRSDGGPTSWQAIIETHDSIESYREFALAMGDLQLAYTDKSPKNPVQVKKPLFTASNNKEVQRQLDQQQLPNSLNKEFAEQGVVLGEDVTISVVKPESKWVITRNNYDKFSLTKINQKSIDVRVDTIVPGWADTKNAIFPPDPTASQEVYKSNYKSPYPTIISDPGGGGNVGTWVANYRNEPLDQRIQKPLGGEKPPTGIDSQKALDPAFSYSSIKRNNPKLNIQPKLYENPLVPTGKEGVHGTDPYTPMFRAYANDNVQVRAIVGAVDSPHSLRIQGVNWEAEPSYGNSGRRDTQGMGISEHFEMLFRLPPAGASKQRDYLYSASASNMGEAKGAWGIMRAYKNKVKGLHHLKNNQPGKISKNDFYAIPKNAKVRKFEVVQEYNEQGFCVQFSAKGNSNNACQMSCTVNQKANILCGKNAGKQCSNPNGCIDIPMRYSQVEACKQANKKGQCSLSLAPNPLILRASAGEWIKLNLTNKLSNEQAKTFETLWSGDQSGTTSNINIQSYTMSAHAGINPALITYDSATQSGLNIGLNETQSVAPGQTHQYEWYAGNIALNSNGQRVLIPMEFGGVNLIPADPLLQQTYGLFGALIIEPAGSVWDEKYNHSLSATINDESGKPLFTEIVVTGNVSTDASAKAGTQVRLRVLNPNNSTPTGAVADTTALITIEGHGWPEEPYRSNATVIGENPLTQWMGTQQLTSLESYNLLLPSAGGVEKVPGKYVFYYFPKGPSVPLGTLTVTP